MTRLPFSAANQAVAIMEELGVEPTPENYAIWYAYYRKSDVDLVRAVDILISNRQEFDETRMAELREQYGGNAGFVAEATALIQEALGHVVAALGEMGAENDAFVSRLNRFTGRLTDGDGNDQLVRLRTMVNALATEARSIAQENRKLGDALSDTSERMKKLQTDLEGVQKEALTDSLTGLGNRRAFEDHLRRVVIDAMESGAPLSLLMVDIDHFKRLNDQHGHQTGDEVLKLVGRVLRDSVRDTDFPTRYGGEEFAILLTDTQLAQSRIVAERIRERVANRSIIRRTTGESLGSVTLSLGIAEYEPGEPLAVFIERADAALYRAKAAGRNRAIADVPSGPSRRSARLPESVPSLDRP